MIKTIFIDLDDTLWDTFTNNQEALRKVFSEEGWAKTARSFDYFFEIFFPNNEKLWDDYRNERISKQELSFRRFSDVLTSFGIPFSESSIEEINNRFLGYSQQQTKLVDGAKELLSRLKADGYVIALITNGFKEVQYNKAHNSGIDIYFNYFFVSEELGSHKPKADFFHFALTRSNSRREETLVVGDSLEADIRGADNAKLNSIWYNPRDLPCSIELLHQPPVKVKHLLEIPTVIKRINDQKTAKIK